MDWFTTYLAAAENTDIKENLLKGATENGRSYKVYLDGYKMLPFLTGKEKKGALK
jgi:arylsulfatase